MENKALYKIGYGLYVLTAEEDGKDNGCIINTAIQVTNEPNRMAVAVNKKNYTCKMIERKKCFNISVLDEGSDFEIFRHFGFQSGGSVDKFASFEDFERSENGIAYITKNTNAFISCKTVQEIDLGTHIMFIADVVDAKLLGDKQTVTYNFYQENIKPKTKAESKKGYVCDICGYVYEGEELPEDFICPICKHPASDFSKL